MNIINDMIVLILIINIILFKIHLIKINIKYKYIEHHMIHIIIPHAIKYSYNKILSYANMLCLVKL